MKEEFLKRSLFHYASLFLVEKRSVNFPLFHASS